MILEKITPIFETHKNKDAINQLLFILIQCSIFGDFGLTKAKLCRILEKGNTKVTEFLGVLKKHNLCTEIQSGKYHYYQANLEELDKLDNKVI